MFGASYPCSMPLCPQPIMCPYDVPVPQPCPCPYPVPQPYIQNVFQPVDVPIQNTIQPVIVPTPVGVPCPQPIPIPVERPCAVPVPQPIPVPVERQCPVPVPVCVPVPQPCAVPQPILIREPVCVPVPVPTPVPVPQPYPCSMPQECYISEPCYEECVVEEPIYVKRCRHRRRRCHRPCTPIPAHLPPIIIPIPVQGPTFVQEPPALQVTEYIQDIYPPAEVYSQQVPIGFVASNSVMQQPAHIQNQQTMNCQPGVILSSSQCVQPQQQIVRQLSRSEFVQGPQHMGCGNVQTFMSSQ